MIPDQTAPSVIAAAPLATTLPVELSAADRARVDAALRDSRAGNTRAQYRSAYPGTPPRPHSRAARQGAVRRPQVARAAAT